MKNIYPLIINLPPAYVSMHRLEIQSFFEHFNRGINEDFNNLALFLKPKLRFAFNQCGGLIIPLDRISEKETARLQTIESSYFGCPFFKKDRNTLINRGVVYYITSLIEDDEIKIIRILSMLEVSIDLLKDILEEESYYESYAFYSLLDEVRYKTLILYEHVLTKKYDEAAEIFKKLVRIFSCTFYKAINIDYNIEAGSIRNEIFYGIDLYERILKEFSANYSQLNSGLKFRTYKEADHPELVWMFLNKLRAAKINNIETVIGIRFGGIELPFLVRGLIYPNAEEALVKVSTYTDSAKAIEIKAETVCSRNILIVDDNILTGRTLDKLIAEIKKMSPPPRNIFFACIAYSGMKRYAQMIMNNHGCANTYLLENSCIVNQSPFTTISSSRSYKNKNGVFDKIKQKIQGSLDNYKEFEFKI